MRYTLPQRATRHALIEEGAHVLAGSSPVRRGIAVAAVVGGALSVAGAAVAVDQIPFPRDTAPDDLAAIGLAADDTDDDADADDDSDDSEEDSKDDSDESPVLDTSALAETVREANEEGRRLAEEQESDDDSDDDSEATPPPPPPQPPRLPLPRARAAPRRSSPPS